MGAGDLAERGLRRLLSQPVLVPRGNLFMVPGSSTAHIFRSSAFRTPAFRKLQKARCSFEMPFSPSSSRYCLHPHLVVSVSVHNGIMTAAERAWRSFEGRTAQHVLKELLENEPREVLLLMSSFLKPQPLCPCCTAHLCQPVSLHQA